MTVRSATILIAFATLTGCAGFDENPNTLVGDVRTDAQACSSQLIGSGGPEHDELDSGNIRLINWNIQKGGDPEWTTDLATFQANPHLMILQEVPFNTTAWDVVAKNGHQSFAPGYRTSRAVTGVMTVSAAKPLTQCNLVSVEPWIRSAKATVITEYGLTNTDQTLLVVNIHAVNFTFGTRDFEGQIRDAMSVVQNHAGPILLSGDFNTWHSRRTSVLNELTDSLNLEMLDFDEDHRKRVFGRPLDHIYVRGLEAIEATTREVDSSDHNPMSARLQIYTQ
jgi:endonuclease/exonuclease/phosphatase (EEP) superfamily protein YafD